MIAPAKQLCKGRHGLHRINVDAQAGSIAQSLKMLKRAPRLISVMLANTKQGAIQDIETLAEAALPTGACFHSDAVQAFGKIPVDFRA